MSKFIESYRSDLDSKKIFNDKKQKLIINELNILFNNLVSIDKRKESIFFSDVFNFFRKDELLGLYIWGGVGRGKTYLVDLFFSCLPFDRKVRLHFHHFMNLVHVKLKENTGAKDPLKLVAKWFFDNYIVICLDEFFVKDIGDAMNLSKLFSYLFEYRVFFVITSNVIPNKLYDGGLQRQKFLPAVYLLEKFLKIINIDGNIDYRSRNLEKENVYLYPLTLNSFRSMKKLFFKLSTLPVSRKKLINILGRPILYSYMSGSIIWFDFKIICGSGRSQLDYIEIASLFDTVFLSGVRVMSLNNEDEARRFISLIDEFYDRKINVILSADCQIDNLYLGGTLTFDFKRTISRLNEMSTTDYLKDFDKDVF